MQDNRDERPAPVSSDKEAGDLATPSLYAAAILLAVVLVYFTFASDVPSEIETAATDPGVELKRAEDDALPYGNQATEDDQSDPAMQSGTE